MTLDKIETLLLTLALIVPGFIIHCVFSFFSPRRIETKEVLLLRFLTFGTLNLIVCLPIIYLIATQSDIENVAKHSVHTILKSDVRKYIWLAAYFLVVTFVSPTILGLVIAAIDKYDWFKKLAGRLGLHAMHSIPTAWDYKFHQICQSGGRWITVALKDDRVVTGFFGSRSFASSDPAERDLYIQSTVDAETMEYIDRSDGILIKYDDIRSIEFVNDQPAIEQMKADTVPLDKENHSNGRQENAACNGRTQSTDVTPVGIQGPSTSSGA